MKHDDTIAQLHAFLISTPNRGKWSPLCCGHLTPEKSCNTHWIEDWMGSRTGVDPLCELQLLICDLGHVKLDRSRGYEICIHYISICVSYHITSDAPHCTNL